MSEAHSSTQHTTWVTTDCSLDILDTVQPTRHVSSSLREDMMTISPLIVGEPGIWNVQMRDNSFYSDLLLI